MHIQHEVTSLLQIQAYDSDRVIINNNNYFKSIILINNTIKTWDLNNTSDLNIEEKIQILFEYHAPIIIGHDTDLIKIPEILQKNMIQHNTSVELMSIGSACRTFNILQIDHRPITLGLIFS